MATQQPTSTPGHHRSSLACAGALALAACTFACTFASTFAWAAPPRGAAATALPAVNLTVELRIVDEAAATGHGGYTVSTLRPAEVPAPPLLLKVLNGQSAVLRLDRAQPVQWVQATAGAASAPAGAVVSALQWMPAGQALAVQPNWPGGSQPVMLVVRATEATLHSAPDAALPATQRRDAGTTFSLPLGAWATFAATGTPTQQGQPGELSTLSLAVRGRQLMQVRVSLPTP